MAGAGYKLFNTGDVLTAAQVNTYLQEQVVMVFANATARTTALSGVLAEGMVSYLKDTNATEVYDGSAWVGIGNSGDITGVTAGTGISGGGTSGTVTITNDMATTITAAGDIVVGTGSGTYDNLPIGTTGQVLTADTTVSPYKVKWATASSSSFVGCDLRKTANQSITSGGAVLVTWDSENFDTNGFHDNTTNNSRITIPSGQGGYYLFYHLVRWGSSSSGQRNSIFYLNGVEGSSLFRNIMGGSTNQIYTVTWLLNLAAGDYVQVYANQDSGSSLDLEVGSVGQTTSAVRFGCVRLG